MTYCYYYYYYSTTNITTTTTTTAITTSAKIIFTNITNLATTTTTTAIPTDTLPDSHFKVGIARSKSLFLFSMPWTHHVSKGASQSTVSKECKASVSEIQKGSLWETKDSIYNTYIQLGDIYIYAHISTYESDQCAQTGDVQCSSLRPR